MRNQVGTFPALGNLNTFWCFLFYNFDKMRGASRTKSQKHMKELSPAYNPKQTEEKIYKKWLDSGYFNPDNLPGKREKKYTVMIAPPNITGNLHMGHALENTISDILIRFHRMRGYKTLWLPGTDHGGISTNTVVEKDLKKQGINRHDLGKEKFIEEVWKWREKYGNIILDQLKRMGFSLDWSRTTFTMDANYRNAVKTAFEKYKAEGLIYQGERLVNWCIKDQTALSDLELEYVEEKSKLWHLKYPVKGSNEFITVATTRPETMLGDTAVAVNPKDPRYANLIGKAVMLPIVNREIPIVADQFVEMEFGTGAVKITPAHDFADSETAERNQLPFLKVINEIGKIINVNGEFNGLKIMEAREKVLEKLRGAGLLEKEEEFTHNVAKCYRCGLNVEPMLSKQWFLKIKPLAEKAIRAIEQGSVKYYPEKWANIALERLRNERDWCISRQIWWGHPIPAEGGADTFDTWFSSALWPFAALGWPEKTKDLQEFYPTTAITSGRDILHIWISKMIFSGLEFTGQAPFKDVLIHATILTKDGRRMSKSLGTGIDPIELIEKYGADATRFGLIYQALGGQDIHFNEEVLMMGKKFCNKIWNIAKFVQIKTGSAIIGAARPENPNEAPNKNILEKLAAAQKQATEKITAYEFGQAAHDLYDFIWHEFADIYIEESKKSESAETRQTLSYCLQTILKILHPFMPFITEELWAQTGGANLLMIEAWPN